MGTHRRLVPTIVFVTLCTAGCADPQSDPSQPNTEIIVSEPLDATNVLPTPFPQDDIVAPNTDAGSDALPSSDGSDGSGSRVRSDAGPGDITNGDTGTMTDVPSPDGVTERLCRHTVTYVPTTPVTTAQVATSFLGWGDGAIGLVEQVDGTFSTTLDLAELAPGSYGYKLIIDGEWLLDPSNKMRRFDDETVNSKLLVPECRAPELVVSTREVDASGASATIEVVVHAGLGTPLDPESVTVTHNFTLVEGAWDAERGSARVVLSDLPEGKHTLRVDAAGGGFSAEPVVISFWVEPTPFDWRDATLYFAFTDRFVDGDPTHAPDPCLPADSIANWYGGDWLGVKAKIDEGYFDSLGVRALWLNAPMDNPEGCVTGLHDRQYTAFHGYFPSDLFGPEPRFGSLKDLRDLVTAAHARGIRVIVDLTANHLHASAPEWTAYADTWFNIDGLCRDQNWIPPETCWFETYLPDLDHRNDEAVEHLTEAALTWAIDADLDGFRVDAVKHMHPHFLNTLRAKLDRRIEAQSDQVFWTVGETFTGGWQPGGGSEAELMKTYISTDQLYGQFDFPLFWAVRGAFALRDTPLSWLGEVAAGSATYYGDGAIMASFLGNHDVTRFVSVAQGDDLDDCPDGGGTVPWDCPPSQPETAEPYTRLVQAYVFLTVYPAVPLIYYGDEIGLAGADDPDNRRPMPWDDLTALQQDTRTQVAALLTARGANDALRRGGFTVLEATETALVIERTAATSRAYGAFNLGTEDLLVTVAVPDGTTITDVLGGTSKIAEDGTLTWTVPPETAQLWTTSP